MSDFAAVFDRLCRERGGVEKFDVIALECARKLAATLTGTEEVSPGLIAQLTAQLPEKTSEPAPPYDLARLDDKELAFLDYLTRRALGEKPPKPARKPRSERQIVAGELATFLDGVESAQRAAFSEGLGRRLLSADERERARNYLMQLFGLVANVADCFPEVIEDRAFLIAQRLAREAEARRAAEVEAAPPPVESSPPPAPASDNNVCWGVFTGARSS